MLSLRIPAVMQLVSELTIGLTAFFVEHDPIPKLIVKAPKEALLTVRMNQGFRIYLAPYRLGDGQTGLGFLAAFFDDEDAPLVTGGAFIEEFNADSMRRLLLGDEMDVHLFDELNREMLGYRAGITVTESYRKSLSEAIFPCLEGLPQAQVIEQMMKWFSIRDANDDNEAIKVTLQEPLFPEDYLIMDLRAESRNYHGASNTRYNQLVIPEPGPFQERDIVEMLQRIFVSDDIYWSPLRPNNLEEIADVMVVTDKIIMLIQAKDSPNTEQILRNTLKRKRATTKSAIAKAIRQTRGAVSYVRKATPMVIIIDGQTKEIDWSGKLLHSLIVVKELFDYDFDEYSSQILNLIDEIEVPCIALSLNELHEFTKVLGSEKNFLEAYWRIVDHGRETGIFPRLRLHPLGTKLPQ